MPNSHACFAYTSLPTWPSSAGYDYTYSDLQVVENQQQSQKAPAGLLYPRSYFMLAYRQDWFLAANVTPPNTWAELEQLAANRDLWVAAAEAVAAQAGRGDTDSTSGAAPTDSSSSGTSSGANRRRGLLQDMAQPANVMGGDIALLD